MGLKLDLACGANCTEGYEGVDIAKVNDRVVYVHNLLSFPWPFASGSVDSIVCSHFVEHLPMLFWTPPRTQGSSWVDCLTAYQVDDRSIDLFLKFFDEVHRILAPGGEARVVTPQAHNNRAFQDPTHRRFLVPESYLYLDAEWRKLNGLEHAAYGVKCDFPIGIAFVQHSFLDANNTLRFPKAANEARVRHEWNFAQDLFATLKKRPIEAPKVEEVPAAASA